MKKLIFLSLVMSLNTFARSGDGAGNGGVGYVCNRNSDQKSVTITLDIAEQLSSHFTPAEFEKSYDKNYFLAKKLLESIRYDYQLGKLQLQDLFDSLIDIQALKKLNILTDQQIEQVIQVKNDIIFKTRYAFYLNVSHPESYITNDTGEINKLTRKTAKRYGLKNCNLYQIMNLRSYSHHYSDSLYTLHIYESSLAHLNDYNLRALLWHEVIYIALGDETSQNTRKIVSKIMKSLP